MDYNNLVSKELLQYLEEMFPDRLPPAQMDRPDIAEAEMEMLDAPKSEVSKAKYKKKRKGKAKGKSHSAYKGGGLNV